MNEIVSIVSAFFLLAATVAVLVKLFPTRFHPVVCALIILAVLVCHLCIIRFLGPFNFNYGGLRVLLYFPLSLYLFKGPLFQKIFAFSLQLVLLISASTLIEEVSYYLFTKESTASDVFRIALLIPFYIIYVVLATKHTSIINKKIFAYGSAKEWILYSIVEIISFGMMALVRLTVEDGLVSIALIFFILLSSAVLCYAIITTHEKTKQKIDADFARAVVCSGREHYKKMNSMYDKLRILRHDFKYHLSTARSMLRSVSVEEANSYLTLVEEKIAGTEIPKYCGNAVLNAMIDGYAERCKDLHIMFTAHINIPETIDIPDYDMCIIIGNLLENAIEGCSKIEDRRFIELEAQVKSEQLLVMVKNNFDGIVLEKNGSPLSTKTNGGFGLKSVREVVSRHNGDLLTEWNGDIFTAYAAVKISGEENKLGMNN